MISKIFSAALYGIDAYRVIVEVHVGNGMGFYLSGLPDDAIKECRSRVEIALQSNNYIMPRTKLSVNLAPADVRKIGTGYDLPIALGILLSSDQVWDFGKLKEYMVVGELGLDGCIYGVKGALSMAIRAKEEGFKGIVLPGPNAEEASLVKGLEIFSVNHLRAVIEFIHSDASIQPYQRSERHPGKSTDLDFEEVKGQRNIKRGLEIAAAGGHHSILIGPPGVGKTMLAKRLPSILPPLTERESLETTQVYSAALNQEPLRGLITQRPFRNPHHTISEAGLAGGGSHISPGEISLAHNGVLFLDELAEFRRAVIEVLRQPLEERKITIGRAKGSVSFPASFMLLASMNPCPCGYYGDASKTCTCSMSVIQSYRRKISGPLLDRIDLHVDAEPVPFHELMELGDKGETSSSILERVVRARGIQEKRLFLSGVNCNAQIADKDLAHFCPVEEHAQKFLLRMMEQYGLSARAYARILKISRTIADLGTSEIIQMAHIAEAIHFRSLDKPLSMVPGKKEKYAGYLQRAI